MMLKREEIEGIYYSRNSGRIFEAIKDGHGCVIIRYCDNSSPEFGPCALENSFRLQHALGLYEIVINYNHEGL